ncbi:MAG: YihY/virulence factor BrkB family protein [Chitinivibrionales bacterium]
MSATIKLKFTVGKIREVATLAFSRFMQERGPEAAAAISFFTLFSLFPLALLLVAGATTFMETHEAREQIMSVITDFAPQGSYEMIEANLQQVLEAREAVGIMGAITLLWTASGVFNLLTRNLSRAWPSAPERNFIGARLIAVGIVAGLFLLLVLFFLLRASISIIDTFNLPLGLERYVIDLIHLAVNIVVIFFTFIIFLLLYRLVPNARVKWREAAGGALFSFALSQLVTAVFGWYLNSGFARYNLIYGSLGALVAFLFWTYLTMVILIAGAHLSSSIADASRSDQNKPRSIKKRSDEEQS